MPHSIDFKNVAEMISDEHVGDDAVAVALPDARISLNAEAVASGRLALACLVGHHRPRLLATALAHAVYPMIAMGVETAEQFWGYAEFLGKDDRARGGPWWSETASTYLSGRLREQDLLVRRVLGEGLIDAAQYLDSAGPACRRAGLRCLVEALAVAEAQANRDASSSVANSLRRVTGQDLSTPTEWGQWLDEDEE